MSMTLKGPKIVYLENSDFNSDGTLKDVVFKNKKILIFIQANWCGHCQHAKPDYQQFADLNQDTDIICTTVLTDNEPDLATKFSSGFDGNITPVKGFPTYYMVKGGTKEYYENNIGRDKDSLKKFIQTMQL